MCSSWEFASLWVRVGKTKRPKGSGLNIVAVNFLEQFEVGMEVEAEYFKSFRAQAGGAFALSASGFGVAVGGEVGRVWGQQLKGEKTVEEGMREVLEARPGRADMICAHILSHLTIGKAENWIASLSPKQERTMGKLGVLRLMFPLPLFLCLKPSMAGSPPGTSPLEPLPCILKAGSLPPCQLHVTYHPALCDLYSCQMSLRSFFYL